MTSKLPDTPPTRLESLDSGFKYPYWASNRTDSLEDSMALFFAQAGLDWSGIKSSNSDEEKRAAFQQQLASLPEHLKYIKDWFDVGDFTIYLAHEEGSGLKLPHTFAEKYTKFQECLSEVMIPPDEIEAMIKLLKEIRPGAFIHGDPEALTQVKRRLRYLAKFEDQKISISTLIRKNPVIPVEIEESFSRFSKCYPDSSKVAFIMMRFGQTPAHQKIIGAIRKALSERGITGLRADDKEFHPDLFSNVLTYIYGCSFGIAVFERIDTEIFNPNVALEVGYMSALRKPVCLLKDKTLGTLPTDLVGKLYRDFDPQRPNQTIPTKIIQWLRDKDIANESA